MSDLLASSGNFKTAAAAIIGVARRKEKRAASTCDKPESKLPVTVAPVLENPGIRAIRCV